MKKMLALCAVLAVLACGCQGQAGDFGPRTSMGPFVPPETQAPPTFAPTAAPLPSVALMAPEAPEAPAASAAPEENGWAGFAWPGLRESDLGVNDVEKEGFVLNGSSNGVSYDALFPGLTVLEKREYVEGATGENIVSYNYEGGENSSAWLESADGRLRHVEVKNYDQARDAHGLRVGMALADVTAALGLPAVALAGPETEELYSAGQPLVSLDGKPTGHQPPVITAERELGTLTLYLTYPVEPYEQNMDPWEYLFRYHFSLRYSFDAGGKLTAWSWYCGAFGE